ncbi:MAG: ribonuclease J, partial [Dehalococcoidia bacterium]
MAKKALKVIPLGGLGEIGKNMLVLEYDDDIIVIDAGVMFPSMELPGIDLIIPDISYLLENSDKVRGVVITHGHEDHTGALPYLVRHLDVSIFAPRLAKGLISVKLKEHGLLKGTDLQEMAPGDRLSLGAFQVEPFRVCHSIPDAMGLAIDTPIGTLVHTGDFKFDHTPVDGRPSDLGRLAELGSKGVLLLLSDSTYVELPGYTPSEQVVSNSLDRIMAKAEGRVIVTTFASLISRVQQVVDAAVAHDRKVCVEGR